MTPNTQRPLSTLSYEQTCLMSSCFIIDFVLIYKFSYFIFNVGASYTMVRGPEWSYVEELKQGKTTSYVRCRSCGHTFHGSATRIKEHLFGVGANVERCSSPPGDIHVRLQKYANKIRSTGDTRSRKRVAMDLTDEQLQPSMQQTSQGQCSRAHSMSGNDTSGDRCQTEQVSIAAAFDKQSMLELHLKWTQAFMACGILFNVI